VSKHWNPDGEIERCLGADAIAPPAKPSWPKGATAGLVLVAASCLAVGMALYTFAGPRDVVEESVSGR
jgi:hypothetical protein